MENNKQTYIDTDSVSMKELILKCQDWGRYLLGKWKFFIIVFILGAGLGFFYALQQIPKYLSELTFVLEDSKQSPLGAYAGLASQFGLDLGGASGSGVFSGDNILEFLKSRLMVEKALLSPVKLNTTEVTLAERFMQTEEAGQKWRKKEALKNISFPVGQDRKSFSVLQDSVLALIYQEILQKQLSVLKPDKKLSFISVKCISADPYFAKTFTERLVTEATDFYVATKTQRSKTNVAKLQATTDSIQRLLDQKTYSAAASQDLNLNPARNMARVSYELASRDKTVLMTMFAEATKNLEISKITMAQETPIIQIVDTPIFPLKKVQFGKAKGMVSGALLAVFSIMICLILVRLYKIIMS